MKNKNLLYCFTMTTTSVKAKRLAYQEKGPDKQPETSRATEQPGEYEADRKEMAYRKETMRSAKWMLKHLQEKNFGPGDEPNMAAKRFGKELEDAIVNVEWAEREKKSDVRDVYMTLRNKLESSKSFVNEMNEKNEKVERKALRERAYDKLTKACIHFESDAVKEKNTESLRKVVHDYMYDWWKNELNDHEREILSRPLLTADGPSTDIKKTTYKPTSFGRPESFWANVDFLNAVNKQGPEITID
ncbi:hypothetical protein KJ835_01630 [Patescibacteria group bacterium]|nr:hypothetical protein [Patescibacteria group bacterium]